MGYISQWLRAIAPGPNWRQSLPDKTKTFGGELRRLRVRAKKSMGEVARAIGKSVVYYSHVEGDVKPPFSPASVNYEALSNVLGVPSDDLIVLAARTRRSVELRLPESTEASEIGLALARMFSDGLTAEQIRELRTVVQRRDDNA